MASSKAATMNVTIRTDAIGPATTRPPTIEVDHGGIVMTVEGAALVARLGLAVDLVAELVAALPRCERAGCGAPATRTERFAERDERGHLRERDILECDEHGSPEGEDVKMAEVVRRAKEAGML